MAKSRKKTQDLKISDEELKRIQESVGAINKIQLQIGGLEVQKYTAISALQQFQAKLEIAQKELQEKYGNVSVNLQTGALKETPKDGPPNKKN